MIKFPLRRNRRSDVPAEDMSLVGHLGELRSRIIRSVLAVVFAAAIVWVFFDPIFTLLSEPYCSLRPEDNCTFLVTDPLGEFNVRLTVSGYGGLILALPVILYQIGRFVLPGLYPHEKKIMAPFLIVATGLLVLGMGVAYLFLPRALEVLAELGTERFESFFTPNEYMSFFIKMLLAFGLAFELPLILIFLQLVGVLRTETLRKNRRIAVVLVVILGAVITPTGDPFTLMILSVPMYLFYEIAMIVGGRMTKNRLDVS